MGTVGDRINELTKEYCKIYDDMCEVPSLEEHADSIALHDPLIKKFTWEQVEKNVRRYIASRK